jgi:hypothetical protein
VRDRTLGPQRQEKILRIEKRYGRRKHFHFTEERLGKVDAIISSSVNK